MLVGGQSCGVPPVRAGLPFNATRWRFSKQINPRDVEFLAYRYSGQRQLQDKGRMGGCVQLGQHRDRCRSIVLSIRLLVDRAWFWRLVDHFFCHCMFHFAVMGGYFPETNKDGVVRGAHRHRISIEGCWDANAGNGFCLSTRRMRRVHLGIL